MKKILGMSLGKTFHKLFFYLKNSICSKVNDVQSVRLDISTKVKPVSQLSHDFELAPKVQFTARYCTIRYLKTNSYTLCTVW